MEQLYVTLTWAQQYSAILSLIGSLSVAVGTFSAAWITANRYLKLYQTHVSTDFFRRYAEISQRMPDQLRLAKVRRDVPCEVREDDWARIDRAMIDYINLCSEEYALRKEKRIPNETSEKILRRLSGAKLGHAYRLNTGAMKISAIL